MNEDIIAIVGFFSTVIIVTIGLPLVRAYIRRKESEPRFVTKLLAERETPVKSLPQSESR